MTMDLILSLQGDSKNKTPDALKNGVVMDRSCTDILMCTVFTIFFCGMFATAAYGYANGDPLKVITAFDSDGNQCGKSGTQYENYKALFWPNLNDWETNSNALDQTVCVNYCPDQSTTALCMTNSQFSTCPIANYETKRCKYYQFQSIPLC